MYKTAYFPGCSLSSTAREYDISTKLICKDLEIELVEIPDWLCCGATTAHITDELASIVLPIKNLLWPEKQHLPVTAPCSACFSRLKLADISLKKDAQLKTAVTEVLGEEYKGMVDILHLWQVIEKYGDLKPKKELKGLRVASYYGCLLTRPKEVCDYDRIEDPQFLDNLVSNLGAEAIKWAYKTECCGAAFSLTKKDIVLTLSQKILKDARDAGADCIITACPLCHSNLDARQAEMRLDFSIPILYFTQLIGLGLGYGYRDLMLHKHFVSPKGLLKAKGLL
ncbi:CoB--CoM heterodisulfide reductase iron-sulfur subunit B family protein [bacterium]|nr:CoB--CoM heterodisulfide reductase iron-sulfur subunit B family protein [bacterium]MBU1754628.1 CoB--CoM heterodisulfide reductase iron-sulfur subunit B family protein [bacterium]